MAEPLGALTVVGIGPGDLAHLTPAARDALAAADLVVGYGLYLDLVADVVGATEQHRAPLGEEVARAEVAVLAALAGRRVALVSSGDAGVYGLAGLAYEVLAREGRADLAASLVRVVPGVSAAQAAASLLGAPLVHDWASISLSDLMTPWERIERRVSAAAEADFVIVLYNPKSRGRDWQLARALELVGAHRAATTPVGIVTNAARTGERVERTTLGELDPERVDMLTTVVIGNASTVAHGALMWTPRGYPVARGTRPE